MGKASRKRHCPVVGGIITPGECGESRNSRYACPGDCPHNPLTPENYDDLLAVEDALDFKAFRRLVEEDGDDFRIEFERALKAAPGHGGHPLVVWRMFFNTDSSGLTFAQRWEREGFPGLKNDERVLLRGKMRIQTALLETRRVIDDRLVEAVDLLAPGDVPLRCVDRSLAGRTARFTTMLAWVYPTPHLWRPSGAVMLLPEMGPFAPDEILREVVRHLGGPGKGDPMRRWLAENFTRVDEAITATAHERRRQMLANLDAQWGNAVYELRAPFAECRAFLDAQESVESRPVEQNERNEGFAEARIWFDDRPEAKLWSVDKARPVLGGVLLGQDRWRLEASSAMRLSQLRESFEKLLGARVRFRREQREDLSARLALDVPQGDVKLIPSSLLESPDRLITGFSRGEAPVPGGDPGDQEAAYMTAHLRSLPDQGIPALDGHTPREAARDPKMRPRVIKLVKSYVRQTDERNLREDRNDDINWLVRELGLNEIDIPAPPRRKAPADVDNGDEEDFTADPEHGRRAGKASSAPRAIPARPYSVAEASKLLEVAIDPFETAAEALDEMEASGSTLIDDLYQITEGLFEGSEFDYMVPFLITAWFALVPRGAPAPKFDGVAFVRALNKELARVPEWMAAERENMLEKLIEGARQPHLTLLLVTRWIDSIERAPREIRPDLEGQPIVIAVLKTVVNEIDRALRG